MTVLPCAAHVSASSAKNTISTCGRTGTGRQTLGEQTAFLDGGGLGGAIEHRAQKLVERFGLDAAKGLVLADQFLVHHLDGDAHAGEAGALAVAALKHEQLLVLDGELDVLHVLVVLFELLADFVELLVGHREVLLEVDDLLRRTDAGDHVFALGVDQELTIEEVLARRRIAREAHAGGRVLALVAEYHGLHVDRSAPIRGNVVELAVDLGAVVFPAAKHGLDGAVELVEGVGREVHALVLFDGGLELAHKLLERRGRQLRVDLHADGLLLGGEDDLERVVILLALGLHFEHDVAVHGDEAAIGIVGEALVARGLGQTRGGLVIEAEVQDRVHHARHRGARARADRDEKRVRSIAELLAKQLLHLGDGKLDVGIEILREFAAGLVELGAHLGGDGEAGRHRHADVGHLGEVGTLAAEQVLHVFVTLGLAAAEEIHALHALSGCWCFGFGLGCLGGSRFGRFHGFASSLLLGWHRWGFYQGATGIESPVDVARHANAVDWKIRSGGRRW